MSQHKPGGILTSQCTYCPLVNDENVYQTEYPEGFEGEVFQLLVDQDIILNTDTEPAGFQDYLFAFLPWLFLAAFMFYMFSQVRSNGNQIMQFGKSKAKELDDVLQPVHTAMFVESNPSPVKYAAKLMNLCDDEVRLPLVKVTEETKIIVKKNQRHFC